jgi:hypothetical protein
MPPHVAAAPLPALKRSIVSKTSGDQIIGTSASTNIDPGCGGTYQITVGIEHVQKARLVEAGIWLNPL